MTDHPAAGTAIKKIPAAYRRQTHPISFLMLPEAGQHPSFPAASLIAERPHPDRSCFSGAFILGLIHLPHRVSQGPDTTGPWVRPLPAPGLHDNEATCSLNVSWLFR